MYLKSLVLKGFKSFADRSVLTLEPGITAVVGPNGSGKSNISDAVLWVLGERNAKHLRGQAMEDVIFAGSSARKATGLAEVDLVLDNSDGTLPVEYDEVAITRRMYRNGESEYLINGSVARRMDVLDILHDSGLGTGTHSIISQGSLDSILQSKPEDRRALIEEAAGVLKHKQRKAKSERKLQQMDAHLARAKDIVREVERQLAPLERKAKRAKAYEGLSAELEELTLALAVDDLRMLQKAWNAADAQEKELSGQLDERRRAVEIAEERVQQLQEQVRAQSADAGELARQHGRAASAVERIDGAVLLLHEKRRAAQNYEADLLVQLESDQAKLKQAQVDLEQAAVQVEQVRSQKSTADEAVSRLLKEQGANAEQRRMLDKEADEAARNKRNAEREQQDVRRRLAETQEALASGLAHMKLVESHGKELELQLSRAQADVDRLNHIQEDAEAARAEAQSKDAAARACVADALLARNEARQRFDAARMEAADAAAEVRALEEVERASASGNPMAAWLRDSLDRIKGSLRPLSHAVRVEGGYERLVEGLLGKDLATLLIDSPDTACEAVGEIVGSGCQGEVALLPRQDASRRVCDARAAAHACGGWALMDRVACTDCDQQAVASLLGDVVVCESVADAFAAHAEGFDNVRFATPEGCIVNPSGKVTIVAGETSDDEGVLARVRKLDAARQRQVEAHQASSIAETALQNAESCLQKSQAESLQCAQELAEKRGAAESAKNDARHAEDKLAAVRREFESVQSQRQQAEQTVAEARPSVDLLEARLTDVTKQLEDSQRALDEAQERAVPLRKEAAQLRDALGDARLQAAKLAERETYSVRMVDTRNNEIVRIQAAQVDARETLLRKQVAQMRAASLLAVLEELSAAARSRARVIEEAVTAAQHSSSGLHRQVDDARAAARKEHELLDDVNARLSEARVSKGRLEVQVETAVSVVVKDCGTPMDHALALPQLEDRGQAEEAAFKLRKRIASMGAINPDAAREYDQVKARYDYLSSQLADLEGARKSLTKIIRVIDARMKDDFLRTFDAVNRNFQEIFAVLFPGGSAHLTLVDADDPEHSGVEVSAQPQGKRITKMMLMSGGEKSLTALALLFAVYRIRTTPFYILDEVEAALDDSNLRRLTAYLQNLRDSAQLIMITHQRRTMEMADVLFGVSMQADGVTRVVSQKLSEAVKSAE